MPQKTRNEIFTALTKPQTKSEITDETVRSIQKKEADAHEALTRRLREARLAREAVTPKPAKTTKRTSVKARTRQS